VEYRARQLTATQQGDFIDTEGRLVFAPNESLKSFTVLINEDGYAEGEESLTLELRNPSGGATLGAPSSATLVIIDDETTQGATNPIEQVGTFVCQQYHDFLMREPDAAGFADWTSVLENCGPNKGLPGSPSGCDRDHVSSGFYRSREFLDSGYFAFRFYDAVLGRLPLYREFIPDMVRVGGAQSDAEREASKVQFISDFMLRPEFISRYGTPTAAGAEAFVTALEQAAGITVASRAQLVAQMQTGALSPAQTLRAFIETDEITAKFFYRGFVAMQYFGYLRRDPEPAGYDDWVDVLTNGRASAGIAPNDYRHLINGFIYSLEYRGRFGPQ
jgi:hypothetical protein